MNTFYIASIKSYKYVKSNHDYICMVWETNHEIKTFDMSICIWVLDLYCIIIKPIPNIVHVPYVLAVLLFVLYLYCQVIWLVEMVEMTQREELIEWLTCHCSPIKSNTYITEMLICHEQQGRSTTVHSHYFSYSVDTCINYFFGLFRLDKQLKLSVEEL